MKWLCVFSRFRASDEISPRFTLLPKVEASPLSRKFSSRLGVNTWQIEVEGDGSHLTFIDYGGGFPFVKDQHSVEQWMKACPKVIEDEKQCILAIHQSCSEDVSDSVEEFASELSQDGWKTMKIIFEHDILSTTIYDSNAAYMIISQLVPGRIEGVDHGTTPLPSEDFTMGWERIVEQIDATDQKGP